jgi:hypothetical protein
MSFITNYLAVKRDERKKKIEANRPRTDNGLPLGIRIGSTVELPETQFLLFGDQLKFKFPGVKNYAFAWSRIDLGDEKAVRIYLESEDGKQGSFLQIFEKEDGADPEVWLWREYQKIYPTTAEDFMDWYMDPNDERREMLEKTLIGYCMIQMPEAIIYVRAVDNDENAGPDWIEPIAFNEKIVSDPHGDEVFSVQHAAMLYGRGLAPEAGIDEAEYVMFSMEEDKEGARISICLGIMLTQPITVI